jgi:hypothetical protein
MVFALVIGWHLEFGSLGNGCNGGGIPLDVENEDKSINTKSLPYSYSGQ